MFITRIMNSNNINHTLISYSVTLLKIFRVKIITI